MPQNKTEFVVELADNRKGPWRLSEIEDRFPTAKAAYPHARRLWTAKAGHRVWVRVVRSRYVDPSIPIAEQPDTRRAVQLFLPIGTIRYETIDLRTLYK